MCGPGYTNPNLLPWGCPWGTDSGPR